jgi:L-threonylcarbamoyladenylate synthase
VRRLAADDPTAVGEAVAALRDGSLVALPTDTVYGLAALPSVAGATAGLFAAKGRPAGVPVAVLVADAAQSWTVAVAPAPGSPAARLVAALWPGPLTLVLARRPDAVAAGELGGDGATVGVRCPDHAFVRVLAAAVGPLATTSANRHGEPTPVDADGVAAALGPHLAVLIDGGRCPGVASTVVDGTDPSLPLLREGALDDATVRAAAGH